MYTYKRVLAGIAAAGLIVSQSLQSAVYWASHTLNDPEFDDALAWMYDSGLTSYNTVDSFRPYDNLTREQAAHFFVNFAETTLGMEAEGDAPNYTDMDDVDHTLADSVEKAYQLGLMRGSDNEFRPTANITRAEFLTVAVRALDGDKDETTEPWWAEYFDTARQFGLTNETDVNAQDRSILRYEAGLMLSRAAGETGDHDEDDMDLGDILDDLLGDDEDEEDHDDEDEEDYDEEDHDDEDEEDHDDEDDEDEEDHDVEGELEVSLNPNSPSDQSVPNSGIITFGKYDFAAGDEDVTINSIEVERSGLGSRNDIRRVWFEQDNKRVSSRQSLTVDNTADLRFSPAMTVQADDVSTLDLVVEFREDVDSGSEHRFAIDSADKIESSVTPAGNFPVRTNLMRTTTYSVASVDITSSATPSGGGDDSENSYNVGEGNAVLWEMDIENESGDEDVLLRSMTVRNAGTWDPESSLDNLRLVNDGNEVSTDVVHDGRNVTFVIDDARIQDGSTELFEIRADIVGAERTDDNYEFELRSESDVRIVEEATLFSASVTLDDWDSRLSLGNYEVRGGDLILSRDTNYTTSKSVSPSTDNVRFLAANLSVEQPITVEDVEMEIDTFTGYGDRDLADLVNSFRLQVDGSTVSTYTPSGDEDDDDNNTIEFEGSFNIDSDSSIQIVGNVRRWSEGMEFEFAEMSGSSFGDDSGDVRYQSNDEEATIDGTVRGINVDVDTPELTIRRNDGLGSDSTAVAGARDVKLLGFSMRANDVSDIRVTGVEFEDEIDQIGDQYISNIRLMKWNETIETSSDFNFSDIRETIEQNSSNSYQVVADFSSSVDEDDEFQLTLSGTWDVTARSIASNERLGEDEKNIRNFPGTKYTFIESGDVELSSSSDNPSRSILTPSTQERNAFAFELEASDDTIRLTDLYVGTGSDNELELDDIRSATLVADDREVEGSVINEDTMHFSIGSSDPIMLRDDDPMTFEVRIALHDRDDAEDLGKDIHLTIDDHDQWVSGVENGLRLVSDSSGDELSDTDITWTAASRVHLFARTKPTVAMVDGFEAGSTNAYEFTITADENRRARIYGVEFQIDGVNVDWEVDLELYNDNDEIISNLTGINDNDRNHMAFGTGDDADNIDDQSEYMSISAGSTETFRLEIRWETDDDQTRETRISNVDYSDTHVRYFDPEGPDSEYDKNYGFGERISRYGNVGVNSPWASYSY